MSLRGRGDVWPEMPGSTLAASVVTRAGRSFDLDPLTADAPGAQAPAASVSSAAACGCGSSNSVGRISSR